MVFVDVLKKEKVIDKKLWFSFLKLLAPFAPFVAEELWQKVNGFGEFKAENSIHLASWPKYDKELSKDLEVAIPITVNGKLRGQIQVKSGEVKDKIEILKKAKQEQSVLQFLKNNPIKKEIYVEGKVVNFVV